MRGHHIRRIWPADPTRYAPARHRRACAHDAFVPDPLAGFRISLTNGVAGVVSDAERAIADLNHTAGPETAPFARLLLRTESIASSKVEGLQMGARGIARAEINRDVGRRIGPDASEILANIDAMRVAVDRAAEREHVAVDDLTAIHRVLLESGPQAAIAGHLRTGQNWIGGNDYTPCGAAFVPPPPEYVDPLLVDLGLFLDAQELPPLVQAAVAHAQFETIHPFDDGNGRTGRALIQIILRRRGLAPNVVPPISVILARHRERYLRGLTLFRAGDVVEWVRIFAAAAAEAVALALEHATRVRRLQEAWRRALHDAANPRVDAAAWSLIDIMPAHPVITIPRAVAVLQRSRPAIATAVEQLVGAGVLTPLTRSARNRAWEAVGLLDLIEALEAGDPPPPLPTP